MRICQTLRDAQTAAASENECRLSAVKKPPSGSRSWELASGHVANRPLATETSSGQRTSSTLLLASSPLTYSGWVAANWLTWFPADSNDSDDPQVAFLEDDGALGKGLGLGLRRRVPG